MDDFGITMAKSLNLDQIQQKNLCLQKINMGSSFELLQQQHIQQQKQLKQNKLTSSSRGIDIQGLGISMGLQSQQQQSLEISIQQENNIKLKDEEVNTSSFIPQMIFPQLNYPDHQAIVQDQECNTSIPQEDISIQHINQNLIPNSTQNNNINKQQSSQQEQIQVEGQPNIPQQQTLPDNDTISENYEMISEPYDTYTKVPLIEKMSIKTRSKDNRNMHRQSKHKNVFKNFGSTLLRQIQINPEFIKIKESYFQQNEHKIKNFNNWLKFQIRLERKVDFINGWTWYESDDEEVCEFKDALRLLSCEFFENYALIYLMNSKRLNNLDVHLASIQPFIQGINDPKSLEKFKPQQF